MAKQVSKLTPPSERLLKAIKPYLHLDDPGGVEVALATVVANTLNGEALWLLIVNPSSSAKTELVQMFDQVDFCEWIAEITEKTFLSGYKEDTPSRNLLQNQTSLLHRLTDPTLRGVLPPVRVLLIQDLTGMITKKRESRDAIFGQMRQIYDGRLVKSTGMGDDLTWEGYVGLLGAVTPVIDDVAELNSILGERFVLYRPERVDIDEEGRHAVRRKGLGWRKKIARLASTCVEAGQVFMKGVKIPKRARERLIDYAQFIAIARTAVPRDGYKKVVKAIPQPEGPGRLAQQLLKLLAGLVAVHGRKTPTEKEFTLIAKVARDTIPKIRLTVIEALAHGGKTEDELVHATEIPKTTIYYLLEDLRLLQVVGQSGKKNILSKEFQSRCERVRIFPSIIGHQQARESVA